MQIRFNNPNIISFGDRKPPKKPAYSPNSECSKSQIEDAFMSLYNIKIPKVFMPVFEEKLRGFHGGIQILQQTNNDNMDFVFDVASLKEKNGTPVYAETLKGLLPHINSKNKLLIKELARLRNPDGKYCYANKLKSIAKNVTKANEKTLFNLAIIKNPNGEYEFCDVLSDLAPLITKKNRNIIEKLASINNEGYSQYTYLLHEIAPFLNEENQDTIFKIANIKNHNGDFEYEENLKNIAKILNSKNKDEIVQMARAKDIKGRPAHRGYNLLEDFKYKSELNYKINNISDKKVLDYLEKNNTPSADLEQIRKNDAILDVYNTFNGNYSHIGDKCKIPYNREYYKFAKENPTAIPIPSDDITKIHDETFDSSATRAFLKEAKIDRLRNYCKENPKEEMGNYFYREYFLKSQNLPDEIKTKCAEINEKFGVKIFLTEEYGDERLILTHIENELSEWQKASSGNAVLPPVLDFSKIKRGYIDGKYCFGIGPAGGFHENGTHAISINYPNLSGFARYIRHELTHANETEESYLAYKKYDLNEIMPKITRNGIQRVDLENCKYKQEFLNAGIQEKDIEYAYNNIKEFIARAAEGDMSKYSAEFRQVLVDFGMPECLFGMKSPQELVRLTAQKISFLI